MPATGDIESQTGSRPAASDLETTAVLLGRARQGEAMARERLARRYLPYLRAFARGRLPMGVRSLEETDDVVQVAMMRGFARLEQFEARRRGSFLVYLRVIVDNLIRDRFRSVAQRVQGQELTESLADQAPTPLERVMVQEERERYEAALARLKPRPREAVVLRFELDCDYETIAEELGIASANAARMVVERALLRMGTVLKERRSEP